MAPFGARTNGSRAVVALALLAILAQLLDFLTFPAAVARAGILGESNPVMAGIYGAAGLPGVALLKLAGVALVIVIALHMRRGWAVLAVVAAVGLFGAWTNVA